MKQHDAKTSIAVVVGSLGVPALTEVRKKADVRFVSTDELPEVIGDVEVLLLWDFFSNALQQSWSKAHKLRWVHVAATGVDKLLFPELAVSPVIVTNARGVFDRPIAEYVLACISYFSKEIHLSRALQEQKVWDTRVTRNLFGSKVLIVGTGGIGRATSRLLTSVGMSVTGAGRRPVADDPDFGRIIDSAALTESVGAFDYVVAALPLTSATSQLIDGAVLRAMKPGAVFINVGRGQTVDQSALQEALGHHLGGAAIDCFEAEPLPADNPLWAMGNVLVSPHMASRTDGWLGALEQQFVRLFEQWNHGGTLPAPVDKQQGYPKSPEVSSRAL